MRKHWLLSFFVVNNTMKNPANCGAICRVCARLHDGFPQILAQTWVQNPPAPAKKKADCVSNLLFSVKSADGGRNPPLVDEIASR